MDNNEYIAGTPIVTGLSLSRVCLLSPDESIACLPYVFQDKLQDQFDKKSSVSIFGVYDKTFPQSQIDSNIPIIFSDLDDIDSDILVNTFLMQENTVFKCRNALKVHQDILDIDLDEVPQVDFKKIRLRDPMFFNTLTLYSSGWSTLATTLCISTKKKKPFRPDGAALASNIDDSPLEGLSVEQTIALSRYFSGLSKKNIDNNCKAACLLRGFCPKFGANTERMSNGWCSRCADGFMTVLWGLKTEKEGMSADGITATAEVAVASSSMPSSPGAGILSNKILAGILTRDVSWFTRNNTEVKERLGNHVGHAEMQAHTCGDHVLLITSAPDFEYLGEYLGNYGTCPAPLRALEYAIYQNALVLSADNKVSNLEKDTASKIDSVLEKDSVKDFRKHLHNITVVHSQVLSQCEALFKPWIFKYELEDKIVKSILLQASTEKILETVRTRLQALNTLATELHSIAAGNQLDDQQERLVGILNTNLVSQLELRRLNKDSQKSTKKLAWLNAIVAFSAALAVLQLITGLNPLKADFREKLAIFNLDFVPISKSFLIGVVGMFVIAIVLTLFLGSIANVWEWIVFRFSEREKDKDMFSPRHSMELNKMLKQAEIVKILVANFNKLNKEDQDNLENELIKQHDYAILEDNRLVGILNTINKMHKKEAETIKYPKFNKFNIFQK